MQPQFAGDDCESTSVHTGDFQDAEDLSAFRMITRRNGDQGYLFVNNYQRGYEMAEHKDVMLCVQTADGKISFPKQVIKNMISGAVGRLPLFYERREEQWQ